MVDSGVSVAIRVRPLLTDTGKPMWHTIEDHVISSTTDSSFSFHYDHVFGGRSTTEEIYTKICSPVVKSFVEGFNATIFAYGQTASGKSYTIMGDSSKDCLGIVPHSIMEIFDLFAQNPQKEYLLNVSYMEIYNEKITDLLNVENDALKIREGRDGTVSVANLTEYNCTTVEDVVQVLAAGTENRTVGATNFNLKSSRAHTIFTIMLESRDCDTEDSPCRVSSMNLVDLAGSEKPSTASSESHRIKEGTYINSSLLSLGNVISSLAEGRSHVPYRDSKLTRILQPSLGGNSKTLIICTVSSTSIEETISTLRFASRATKVKNKPKINEVVTVEQQLRKEVQALIEKNQMLQSQLSGNLDVEERIKLLDKINVLGNAKKNAEKKAEKLEIQLKKHVIGRPQEAMGMRRRTYLLPPKSTPSKEVFLSSPIFNRTATVTKATRRETMLIRRPRNVTFVAKAHDDEEELSDYDTTPVKALDFRAINTVANRSTQTDTNIVDNTDTWTQTEASHRTEAHVQTHLQTQTHTQTQTHVPSTKPMGTQISDRKPLVEVVHRPDKCVYTDLDQSYLCMHRTEASQVHRQLDNVLYENDEFEIQIQELKEIIEMNDQEIMSLHKKLKERQEANEAQEDILCSLQTKLQSSNKKCQSLQEEVCSLHVLQSEPSSKESELLTLADTLKTENSKLTESLKASEGERHTVKEQLGAMKEELSKLETVLKRQLSSSLDNTAVAKLREENTELKSKVEKLRNMEKDFNDSQKQLNDYARMIEQYKMNSEKNQGKVRRLTEENVLLEKRIKEYKMNSEKNRDKIGQLIEENVLLEEKLKMLQKDLTTSSDTKKQLEAEIALRQNLEADKKQMATKLEELHREVRDFTEVVERGNQYGEEDAIKMEELDNENYEVESQIKKLEEAVTAMERKNVELKGQCEDYVRVIEQCNKNGEEDAVRITDIEEENNKLKEKIEKLEEEIAASTPSTVTVDKFDSYPKYTESSSGDEELHKQIRLLSLKLKEAYRISGRGDLMEENIQLKIQNGELSGSLKFSQKQEEYYKGLYEEQTEQLHSVQGLKAEKQSLTKEVNSLLKELQKMKKEKGQMEQLQSKCENYKVQLLRYRTQRNELIDKYEHSSTAKPHPVIGNEPHPLNSDPHPVIHKPHPTNPTSVSDENETDNKPKVVTDNPKTSKDPTPSINPPQVLSSIATEPPSVDNRHLTAHLPFEMPPNVSEEHLLAWGLHPLQKEEFPNPVKPQMSKDQPHLLGFDWEQSILTDPDSIGKIPFTVTPEKPKSHPSQCQQQ